MALIWLLFFFFLRCLKPCQGLAGLLFSYSLKPNEDTDAVTDNLFLQYFSARLRGILLLVHHQKYMKDSPLIKRCHVSGANIYNTTLAMSGPHPSQEASASREITSSGTGCIVLSFHFLQRLSLLSESVIVPPPPSAPAASSIPPPRHM